MSNNNLALAVILICLSLCLGIFWSTIPLTTNYVMFKPEWVLGCLLFWSVAEPTLVGYIVALLVGVFYDSISGTALGKHAICYLLVIGINRRFLGIYAKSGFTFKIFMTMFLVALYQAANYILSIVAHERIPDLNAQYLIPIFTTTLAWAVLAGLIKFIFRKQKKRTFS